MRLLKILGVLVALAGVAVLAIVLGASANLFFNSPAIAQGRPFDAAQGRPDDRPGRDDRRGREVTVLAGRGASIGVSISEALPAEAGGQPAAGVLVDEVRPDSPADRAGLKRGDTIVEFDGERVRSARQFSRLVQETTPGRAVKAAIVRDGQRSEVQITPTETDRRRDVFISGDFGDYMRDLGRDLGRLGDHLPNFDFNFDFDMPGLMSGRRLGVTVNELTSQLAEHFGVRDGLLVTSVTDGTPASRAGLKAGDVITSINGRRVDSRDDLMRELRDADRDARSGSYDVTIGIVRDKKETTVKATFDSTRRLLRGRPA
jgi:C-terminal processing protease CtpA/Prc